MEKPPIGLKPRNIFLTERIQDIKEAIVRYLNANQPVPQEWIIEYNDLSKQIK